MTERDKLIRLIDSNNGYIKNQSTERIVDYLMANKVHLESCDTCEYIKFIKERGKVIELIGKPLKYCPECGAKTDGNEE